ncbi:MAG: hypothetical protein LBQ39_02495 [Tannerellaceae bacterium]|jgi:hypothetical protein|nr:hypothetical protein [Tannerellaceae bacterium]
MKIALLLRGKKQSKTDGHINHAVVFEIEKDKVVGVESEILESKDAKYLSFWALTKKVKEIYIPDMDEHLRAFFRKMGIRVKKYDELTDDRLFQTFIL